MSKQVAAHGKGIGILQEMGRDVTFKDGERVDRHVSIVEISVSCRDLMDKDMLSKSDPICFLSAQEFGSNDWKQYGRTEIVWNNLDPQFVTKFVMEFFFEESQKLKFEVFHVDDKKKLDMKSKHDFLGEVECTLGEVVGSTGGLKKKLEGKNVKKGEIILTAEELGSCKEEITLEFCGKKIPKKGFGTTVDPFLKFSRTTEGEGEFTLAHKTECVKNNLNPAWQPFKIPLRALCNGDYHRTIKVDCYDYKRNGSHELIGSFETTIDRLNKGPSQSNVYDIINEEMKKKKGKKYTNSGRVELVRCKIDQVHSFLDYIKGGCQIHANVAVDFTSSNKDPKDPSSLHYNDPKQPNQYEIALRAVVEILEDYDSDKLFPAFGFGAKVPPDGKISHDFYLNRDPVDPSCKGVDGILDAYRESLEVVYLDGPTNFAPVVNRVAKMAKEHEKGGDNYFILLIITDGVIQDMTATKEAIVTASHLPLSIIIVGVGPANFDSMEILDGDDVRLSSNGKEAERDIVQFVPFREFLSKQTGGDANTHTARLAKEVLYEIPEQFLSYMKKYNYVPKPPIQKQGAAAKNSLPSYEAATKQKVRFLKKK